MNKVCSYRGISVYEDRYAKKHTVILSKASDIPFIVVSPDLSDEIKLTCIKENRNKFIEELLS